MDHDAELQALDSLVSDLGSNWAELSEAALVTAHDLTQLNHERRRLARESDREAAPPRAADELEIDPDILEVAQVEADKSELSVSEVLRRALAAQITRDVAGTPAAGELASRRRQAGERFARLVEENRAVEAQGAQARTQNARLRSELESPHERRAGRRAARPSEERPCVIALVASAGGPKAVSRILVDLPKELAAAIVVLIHQDPKRANELVEILKHGSALPVGPAEDGSALAAGRVVVVPPGKHLLLTPQYTMTLIPSGKPPPSRPSADLLLTSLGVAARKRAIAVVLSGGGHDAATGATAIRAFGGTVLATDRRSSDEFSMPQATIERDEAIDDVLPLEDMPERLASLVGTLRAEAQDSQEA